MSNIGLARESLHQLMSAGVREFCVCPGARNAPLVAILAENPEIARSVFFYEERSAAFYALGRIRATSRPVAVITTSGTAVGELLPAAMEATYSGLPLILVTADRPRSYRGTGAPQTADQPGIFGAYAEESLDLESADELAQLSSRLSRNFIRPLHLNLCFSEPLLDKQAEERKLCEPAPSAPLLRSQEQPEVGPALQLLRELRRPVVVVGELGPEEREAAGEFLRHWGAPVYLEAPSGLRESQELEPYRLKIGDRLLERLKFSGYEVDGLVRLGGVPTFRSWRDLEDRHSRLPVCSLSRLPFSGLARPSVMVSGELASLLPRLAVQPLKPPNELWQADQELHRRLGSLLSDEPRSEPALVRKLSSRIAKGSRVFLGNSLPIREWDLAASPSAPGLEIAASRGLNGIDGQVSTFLGFASDTRDNWGIFGDLTALYDLAAPWAMGGLRAQIAVINNEGGKIFDRMFSHREFQNPHRIRFEGWAKLWNLSYEAWTEIPASPHADQARVIEILPDAEATTRFWKCWNEELAR